MSSLSSPSPPAARTRPAGDRAGTSPDEEAGPRPLDAAACRALLARVGWGVLATVADGQPYAVPVAYALGARDLYLASGPGRKRRALDAHPRVCLTVCDVRGPADWRSVVVEGTLARVDDAAERATAIERFLAQRAAHRRPSDASAPPPGADAPSPEAALDARRLRAATVYRLPLGGASGRVRDG